MFFFVEKNDLWTYGKGNQKKRFDVRKIDLTHFNALMLDPCSPVKAMSENFSFTKIVECSMAIAVWRTVNFPLAQFLGYAWGVVGVAPCPGCQ